MCVQIEPIPLNVIDEIIQEIEANRPIRLSPDWPAARPSAFPRAEVGLIALRQEQMVSE